MDVVQQLIEERTQLYDIIQQNCVRPEIITGHCDDCQHTHYKTEKYEYETLDIKPDIPIKENDNKQSSQQNDNVPQQNVVEQQPNENITQQEITINNNVVPLFL